MQRVDVQSHGRIRGSEPVASFLLYRHRQLLDVALHEQPGQAVAGQAFQRLGYHVVHGQPAAGTGALGVQVHAVQDDQHGGNPDRLRRPAARRHHAHVRRAAVARLADVGREQAAGDGRDLAFVQNVHLAHMADLRGGSGVADQCAAWARELG